LTAISFPLMALVAVLGGSFRRLGGVLLPLGTVLLVVALLALGLLFGPPLRWFARARLGRAGAA
jgi:hypothetical protein